MINVSRPRGRPRAFDRALALATAAKTFWLHGYEGSSIADLTQAMGITPQSLYAAFGSKAALYDEALGWYRTEVGGQTMAGFIGEPDVVRAFDHLLQATALAFSEAGRPHGCMISTAVLNCASETEPVARRVAEMRARTIANYRVRLERGVTDGQLQGDTDTAALARFLVAIVQGLSVQARDGAPPAELLSIVAVAVDALERRRVAAAG